MAFQLSPGVLVTEKDLTNIVPAVATSEGGMVGLFNWGPADEITVVSNEEELRTIFGKPDSNTYEYFFTAQNFLTYGNHLKVIRAVDATDNNAGAGQAKQKKNQAAIDSLAASDATCQFLAKYPGTLGNSLQVVAIDSGSWDVGTDTTGYQSNFDSAPSTSTFAENVDGSNDELHILVIDEDGAFTGISGTVLEKFSYLSKATNVKGTDGVSIYYKDYINANSAYIMCTGQPDGTIDGTSTGASFTTWDNVADGTVFESLTDGADLGYIRSLKGASASVAGVDDLTLSVDLFSNAEEVSLSLLMAGPATNAFASTVIDIALTRKDCVAFVSPLLSDVSSATESQSTKATAVVASKTAIARSSSYYVMDSGWKQQYDKYNDVNRWVPLNGDIAGLCARTDLSNDPWWSPAGYNRGKIKNTIKLAYNPTKTSRDTLYKNGINPVITEAGEGHLLLGDKTGLSKPSSFDRINVRRLFIVLEKAIATAAKFQMFEFNDAFTRALFTNMVTPFLRDVKGRRGIQDFKVVCDDSNNTEAVINRNDFVADIYIDPARSINTIQLNFVATNNVVNFEENIV